VIRVQEERDRIAVARVYEASQQHIFRWWEELDEKQRRRLLTQVGGLDFQLVGEFARMLRSETRRQSQRLHGDLRPPEVVRLPRTSSERERMRRARVVGERLLSEGKVAVVTAAGGQATRMGIDGPKGAVPFGVITGKCLFHIFSERILALRRRHGALLPWFIMVSDATREPTERLFEKNSNFGLAKGSVRFFSQKMTPALDRRGRLIMESRDRIFMNPDGHGGMLEGMAKAGVLEELARGGIEYLFYFQVDNPAVKVADPVMLGLHAEADAEFSAKVIEKREPHERLGLFVVEDGRTVVKEYTEVPTRTAEERDDAGRIRFWAGSIAVHVFSVAFLRRLIEEGVRLDYHIALKAVPHIDKSGRRVVSRQPNAFKFERFVFDVARHTERVLLVETAREEEFLPIKDRAGPASLKAAQRGSVNMFGRWLESCGVTVPRDEDGNVDGLIEISPLFALDAEELKRKVKPGTSFEGSLCLEP